jgi:tetratricopeptide (TPR) repeat protein
VVLVGRDDELAEVERLLDRARRGAGGALVLTGPAGVGKTSMLNASDELATRRRFDVVHTSPSPGQPGRLMWAQLLQAADHREVAALLLTDEDPLFLDAAARLLLSERPRLIAVDDIDRGGADCVGFLAILASRLRRAPTVVLATASAPLGVTPELQLRPLREEDLIVLVGQLPAETRRALWIASRGLPGAARSLAAELERLPPGKDPLVHLALHVPSNAAFLEVDVTLVRLLEEAVRRADDDAVRARLLARLAASLLGEASARSRRRSLADEALALARRAGDPRTLAEVLDARLHALWDPEAAEDRLAAGSEIVDLARAAGEGVRERHGLFWRFTALMELGRVDEAESALVAFEREVTLAGDQQGGVMATARHAMLDILRGRFDDAIRLTEETIERGRRVGLADADNVGGALRVAIAAERDLELVAKMLEVGKAMTRRLPGHFYEATVARIEALLGRPAEASLDLERILPCVLGGSGPRWLGAMADMAFAASTTGNDQAAAGIFDALAPYRGRLVVLSGASTVWGPVSHYLGMLSAQLGNVEVAVSYFEEAIACEEQMGALPFLAHSLAGLASALEVRGEEGDAAAARRALQRARSIAERLGMTVLLERATSSGDEWTLRRDGEDWLLEAATEQVRLRDSRGLHYLRALLVAPVRDIPALELVAGGGGLVAPGDQPVLDDAARKAYRRRRRRHRGRRRAAPAAGDAVRADRAEAERQELLAELRRASGLGGRPRRTSPEAERARVNVTRTLRSAIARIEIAAPCVGAHLRSSVRTGAACRYDPAPGGPARWRV